MRVYPFLSRFRADGWFDMKFYNFVFDTLFQKLFSTILMAVAGMLIVVAIFLRKDTIPLAMVILISFAIYMIQKLSDIKKPDKYVLQKMIYLDLIYYLGITILVLVAHFLGKSFFMFPILVVLLSLSLFFKIILSKDIESNAFDAHILFQIILTAIIVNMSIIYSSYSIIGNDTFEHVKIIELLSQHGIIAGNFLGSNYNYLPLMHIFGAQLLLVLKVGVKLTISVIGNTPAIALILVYSIGKILFRNKVGLLSALMLAVSPGYIQWSSANIIPMTLGVSLWIMFMYLVLKSRETGTLKFFILTIFCFIGILLTHIIATFVSLIFVSVMCLSSVFYNFINDNDNVSKNKYLTITLLIFSVMLFYWIYISGFINYLRIGLNLDSFMKNNMVVVHGGLIVTSLDNILSNLPQLIYYMLFCASALWILSKKHFNEKYFIYGFGSGLFLLFMFAVYMINDTSLLSYRWSIFLFCLLSPLCAWVLTKFKQYNLYGVILAGLIFAAYAGFSLTGPDANYGTGLYYPYGYTNYGGLSMAETSAANWTVNHMPFILKTYQVPGASSGIISNVKSPLYRSPGIVITDASYTFYIGRYLGVVCAEISPIATNNFFTNYRGIILLRSYLLDHNAYGYIKTVGDNYIFGITYPRPNLQSELNADKLEEVYDSGYVWAYKT